MDIGKIKKKLQEHFTDGLVTIVGSGLSMDAGLPGMEELGKHLVEVMQKRCNGKLAQQWELVAAKLKGGTALEEALEDIEIDNPILEQIIDVTAELMEAREREVLRSVYSGEKALVFGDLLPYLSFNTERVTVITTNYDRLIEVAAEIAGFGIDTLFPGQYYGEFNPKLSREALWTGKRTQKAKSIKSDVFLTSFFRISPLLVRPFFINCYHVRLTCDDLQIELPLLSYNCPLIAFADDICGYVNHISFGLIDINLKVSFSVRSGFCIPPNSPCIGCDDKCLGISGVILRPAPVCDLVQDCRVYADWLYSVE